MTREYSTRQTLPMADYVKLADFLRENEKKFLREPQDVIAAKATEHLGKPVLVRQVAKVYREMGIQHDNDFTRITYSGLGSKKYDELMERIKTLEDLLTNPDPLVVDQQNDLIQRVSNLEVRLRNLENGLDVTVKKLTETDARVVRNENKQNNLLDSVSHANQKLSQMDSRIIKIEADKPKSILKGGL
jgi:chromosome segregation ATPase